MIQSKKPKFFYGYIVVAAATFAMVLQWGTYRTFGVFMEPLISDFGWSRAGISGAFTLGMLISGVAGIAFGRLNDRIGPRVVLSAGGVLFGTGYYLMSRASSLWQVYIFLGVIVGIGMGCGSVPTVSTVARWFAKKRGLMSGIVVAGAAMGITIIPPIASYLISTYNWRISYLILSLGILVLMITVAQLLRRDPGQMGMLPYGGKETTEQTPDLQIIGYSFQQALHTRPFWILFAMHFCGFFTANVVLVHIVIHATGLGISPTAAASILSIVGATSIAGRILIGAIGDRIGNRRAFALGFIITLAASLFLLLARELWMFYLFALILAAGAWASNVLYSPMAAELFGLKAHGVISAITQFAGLAGGAVSPLIAGYIFDVTGSYQPAFLVCAAVNVLGLILTLCIRPLPKTGT